MVKLLVVWRYWLLLLLSVLFLSACSKTENANSPAPTTKSADTPTSHKDVAPANADEAVPASADVASDASASTESAAAAEVDDKRLGTAWGDEINSKIKFENLERVSDVVAIVNVFYSGKADGKKVNSISLLAGQVQFSVIDDNGRSLPTYRKGSDYQIQGKEGQSYRLKYTNTSKKIYEVVASVDGLDVLTGTQGSQYNDGYILYPNQTLIIEGFRKDSDTVASFTFSRPEASYTNHNDQGDINNTGVIGTAFFELQQPQQDRQFAPPPNDNPNKPQAFPADN